MNKDFKILINIALKERLRTLLSNKVYDGLLIISEEKNDNKLFTISANSNSSLTDICKLGSSVFYALYSLDDNIVEELGILKYLNKKYLSNERIETGDIAKYARIFVSDIKETNLDQYINRDINSEFKITVNYDDLQFDVTEKYNIENGTNFEILSIQDFDGLDYALIKLYKGSLLDVFCLGFMICLDDMVKNEKTKRKLE